MILPLCVKFCLTPPSPVYQFHKPFTSATLGSATGSRSGSSMTHISSSLQELRQGAHPSSPLLGCSREPVISTRRRVWGGAARADTVVKVSPRRRIQMTAPLLSHPCSLIIPTTLTAWAAAGPPLPLLPSLPFLPHPRWPLCNPFHFLSCKLRS